MARWKAMAAFPQASLWPEFHPGSAWGTEYLHRLLPAWPLNQEPTETPVTRCLRTAPNGSKKVSGGRSGARLLPCLNPQLLLLFLFVLCFVTPTVTLMKLGLGRGGSCTCFDWHRGAAASPGPAGWPGWHGAAGHGRRARPAKLPAHAVGPPRCM